MGSAPTRASRSPPTNCTSPPPAATVTSAPPSPACATGTAYEPPRSPTTPSGSSTSSTRLPPRRTPPPGTGSRCTGRTRGRTAARSCSVTRCGWPAPEMTVMALSPPVQNAIDRQRRPLERQTARRILELYTEGETDKADELLDDIIARRKEWREQ